MAIQGGTSRSPSTVQNPDGSFNIFCYQCRRLITRTTIRGVSSALCYLCDKVQRGLPLTAEEVETYRISQMDAATVSAMTLPEPDLKALGGKKKKWSFSSMTGEMFQAIGRFATGATEPPLEKPKSQDIADGKRRPRLFQNISLGDMEAVDKKLEEKNPLR